MKLEMKGILVCPSCKGDLELHQFETEGGKVKDGVFTCNDCLKNYLIVDFVPRMLPANLYFNPHFIRRYEGRFKVLGILFDQKKKSLNVDSLENLKLNTIKKFGFEWTELASRLGWDDPKYDMSHEEAVFKRKSLLTPGELKDKLVLDAGCGNGRYSYWAAQYGGKVIGVDLGRGVESACQNLKEIENANIVQTDIFNLPFKDGIFDVIFSIGVLMHTGNAKEATKSLVRHLKRDGTITIHLYHKGNFIYEINDFIIRKVTTKLSIPKQISFTNKMYKLARFFKKLRLLRYINALMRLEDFSVGIFDWYSAPIATHHTYKEVYRWFDEFKLKVIRDNREEDPRSFVKRIINPPGYLTVRGIRR